jgi:hypothetical protein
MHGVHGFKVINAKQSKEIKNFERTKLKLLKARQLYGLMKNVEKTY